MKIKIFNRGICVCALLATNSLWAKSSAEMEKKMGAYYDAYDATIAAMGTGIFAFSSMIGFVMIVLTLIANWKIYVKAGKPGWACLIPFYRWYCLYDIAWGSGWLFLLTFIPCVNIVVAVMLNFKLAKAFGQGAGFGFGLLFLNTIFVLILGLGKYEYIGPQ